MIDFDKIEVWMHGMQVGQLALTPSRPSVCAFQYTSEWLSSGFSISPFELPLTSDLKIAAWQPFAGNFGVFADSLPDGWGQLVLHRYLLSKGVDSRNLSILQLLCLVGSNGRGALEYRPDHSLRNSAGFPDFERLAAETEAILENDRFQGEHLEELVQRGGSPGGARPKIFIDYEGAEWLVKFRARGDGIDVGKREYECSLLAKKCGVEMPETRLFDDKWFGVKRFDRSATGKVHIVSASGLLRADYTFPCIDYLHLFEISIRLSHSVEELWKIYRLMCFNVLIGNRDDHARNFSFLYDGEWCLSPAYDLLPCGREGDYHTTSVNDNPLPGFNDILQLARRVGLPEADATRVYNEMKEIVVNALQ